MPVSRISKKLVMVLSSGAALSLGCAHTEEPAPSPPPFTNPPLPPSPSPPPITNPPATNLPTWGAVLSGHPEGATNPPIPELIVTPEGRCYKNWRSSMLPPVPGSSGNRVQACDPVPEGQTNACGTEVQCPPEAAPLLQEYWANQPTQNPPDPQ